MAKTPPPVDPRQSRFAWADPEDIIRRAEARGEVVFEAPAISRLVRGRVRAAKRLSPASHDEIQSVGLPFGVDGSGTCWSCGVEVDVDSAVRRGPGLMTCPGCGAKLPFKE